MFEPQLEQMPHWCRLALEWLNGHDVLSRLLLIMALDMATGICKAVIKRKLNSTTSWVGMCRKVVTLIIIGVCAILDPLAGGLPVSKLAAIAFIVTEAISIMENAIACGVPVPNALREVIEKLHRQDPLASAPAAAPSAVSLNLPSGSHLSMKADIPPSTVAPAPPSPAP